MMTIRIPVLAVATTLLASINVTYAQEIPQAMPSVSVPAVSTPATQLQSNTACGTRGDILGFTVCECNPSTAGWMCVVWHVDSSRLPLWWCMGTHDGPKSRADCSQDSTARGRSAKVVPWVLDVVAMHNNVLSCGAVATSSSIQVTSAVADSSAVGTASCHHKAKAESAAMTHAATVAISTVISEF